MHLLIGMTAGFGGGFMVGQLMDAEHMLLSLTQAR